MDTQQALQNLVLRLGDNNLIFGQRMAEWCSNGPILEEDLAMVNISLDMFGQAESFLDYAAELKQSGTTADQLAFGRTERQYYNNLLAEQPTGDFAFSIVKLLFFSTWNKLLYKTLSESSDEKLAALCAKALKESRYHFRHSKQWTQILGRGTEESFRRMQFAVTEIWSFTEDLLDSNVAEKTLISVGVIPDTSDLGKAWRSEISEILTMAGLEIPEGKHMVKGGINGLHTESLGHLLCEMQFLHRCYPDAKW